METKLSRYKILTASGPTELERLVEEFLDADFALHGIPFVTTPEQNGSDSSIWNQVMFRHPEPSKVEL
jgi:hypothetical protein